MAFEMGFEGQYNFSGEIALSKQATVVYPFMRSISLTVIFCNIDSIVYKNKSSCYNFQRLLSFLQWQISDK